MEKIIKISIEINELENKINDREDHKVNNQFFKRLIRRQNSEKGVQQKIIEATTAL